MGYKYLLYYLGLQVFLVLILASGMGILAWEREFIPALITGILLLVTLIYLFLHTRKRFLEITDFLESVKYKDFSRWFNDQTGSKDLRALRVGFNEVIRSVNTVNREREAQHLYLKKILEMIDTGILAYNTKSGEVLWINESGKEMLNLPDIRNIQFLEKRKSVFFREIILKKLPQQATVQIPIESELITFLISDTVFHIGDENIRILGFQNIDSTVEHTESEAWKKLLSVMTHEIMNSIAPIHSLSETLQEHLQSSPSGLHSETTVEDLQLGLQSIQKRSEGLMAFAKTYRSLHKITELQLQKVKLQEFLLGLKQLLEPYLKQRQIALDITTEPVFLELDMDPHLMEQALINLIRNAMDALENEPDGRITINAFQNAKGNIFIDVMDNGPGIPEEIRDKIFIPFYTSKKTGSGIGLSLCKQIMLLHHGKIQAENRSPKGTVMRLFF